VTRFQRVVLYAGYAVASILVVIGFSRLIDGVGR
jgi:hypothetical protein